MQWFNDTAGPSANYISTTRKPIRRTIRSNKRFYVFYELYTACVAWGLICCCALAALC